MKDLIYSSLVNIDNILASMQILYRLEGQFVVIRIKWHKQYSDITFRIKFATFKALMTRLKDIEDKLDKRHKNEN